MLKRIQRTNLAADWARPEDISPLLKRLLRLRGVASAEEARAFLRPGRQQLRDPFLLSCMAEAVAIIRRAVENRARICVYGDYDVDGVCASAILVSYLKSLGADVTPYLPSRHNEGYGLNEAALRRIAADHDLLVTVDCGITAVELARLAREMGMEVIITDHHRPEGALPDCPVVNPLLNDYPFPYLCGTGVAFQLVAALGGREAAMEYIDYAALATIADIVPLRDENRAIAALGLKKINASPRPGIRALIEAAGLGDKPLSATNVAFQLTPRLNASGRLGDAMRAYDLLVGTDIQVCLDLAARLDEENRRRREYEQAVIDETEEMLKTFDFPAHRVIVVAGEGWNPGVIGLAASRLTERYHYPSVVLSREGDTLTGSCRSIEGVDIHAALTRVADTLVQFGGHSMAAGLKLKEENLARFSAALDQYMKETLPAQLWLPAVEYDAEVNTADLSAEQVYALKALAPFGCGNPAPVFLMKCDVMSARPVGAQGAHLKLTLRDQFGLIDGIWFRGGDRAENLPREAEALFSASINEYQGRASVQAEMKALQPRQAQSRLSEAAAKARALFQTFLTERVYNLEEREEAPLSFSELASRLKEDIQGVLIVAASVEGARQVLAELGPDAPLDVVIGAYPDDRRCFHALAVCPAGQPPAGYRWVVRADLPAGMIPATHALTGCAVSELFRYLPTVPSLRLIYAAVRRICKRPYFCASVAALVRSLAEEADLDLITVAAGLAILRHMALVDVQEQAGSQRLIMAEMVKRDPEDDSLYRTINQWRITAWKGGAGNE